MTKVSLQHALAIGIAIAAGHAAAAGPAKEGTFEGITCYGGPSGVIADGKGFVSITYDMVGTPVRKDGELGFRASERCAGLTQIMGSEATNTGTCLTVDPDGDRMFITFSRRNQEVGSWRAVSGTGKYEGAEATGTWEPMMVPARPARPDFGGSCNKVTGRWKLKQGS